MIAETYRAVQSRLSADLREVPEADLDRPAPACPDWSVKGVLSHLVGNAEDHNAGLVKTPPYEEGNARQVAERADVPIGQLLDRWDAATPDYAEAIVSQNPPLAMIDLCVHEYDIRSPLGDTRYRQNPVLSGLLAAFSGMIDVGQPLRIETNSQVLGQEDAELLLRVTDFELFRAMSGRRSGRQLRALDWSRDIGDDALRLCIVDQGVRSDDLIE